MLCRFLADRFTEIGESGLTVENTKCLEKYVLLLNLKEKPR
jgi:hypothetical protein